MIIDEEEFLLILKLKDLKKQYRTEYQDLRDLRAEIQYCQHLVDQCRHRLLTGAPFGKVGWPSKALGGTGQGHLLGSRSSFGASLWQRQEPGKGFSCVSPGLCGQETEVGKGETLVQEVIGTKQTGTRGLYWLPRGLPHTSQCCLLPHCRI